MLESRAVPLLGADVDVAWVSLHASVIEAQEPLSSERHQPIAAATPLGSGVGR